MINPRHFHTYEHGGKRFVFEHDETYTVDRACSGRGRCDCKERGEDAVLTQQELFSAAAECEKFYQEECEKLVSGKWVVLVCVVQVPCRGATNPQTVGALHCQTCQGWVQSEDEDDGPIGGIVIENSSAEAEKWAREAL